MPTIIAMITAIKTITRINTVVVEEESSELLEFDVPFDRVAEVVEEVAVLMEFDVPFDRPVEVAAEAAVLMSWGCDSDSDTVRNGDAVDVGDVVWDVGCWLSEYVVC